MKKYWFVTKNSMSEYLTYRLNFVLWRVRVVVSVLITFFLWQTIFSGKEVIFNYSESQMMTYIILLSFISAVVLSTQTFRVAEEINRGTLSNFLIRPISYFRFNIARDLSDKMINIAFSLVEVPLIILLFRPAFFWQTDPLNWLLFAAALFLSSLLYFEISMLLSFIGFWSREVWAPRFIFFILIAFLAGTYFPLDIVPPAVYSILRVLPFTYLVFFPLRIYLGGLDSQALVVGFGVTIVWLFILFFVMRRVWQNGLKYYTSEGQ
ncbi:MAG: hypothetical protein UV73_C0012G0082 [Candidatus Gottesmanbacteria bacterium GW2011_GWA2_43_14]|uniref:ABC transporter permease n=1 Tax=Candidatus Gottesmanbacteria bacterium GW2011_GWA2_43_14 TaxID=1618443 RepID=A0A0G1DEK1_9BACT|nr:MAG: hypothetical protein UV73_C0012G0082 [Candidatus Gottesmanbacteria bacterium GW2011_GWA2_43_14]